MTYIIGHIKPDLDSVVAAMALAYFYQHKPEYGHTDAQPVVAGPINNETQFVFDKFAATPPPLFDHIGLESDDKLVLVDYNEGSQRHPGVDLDQVVEIIDHHKVSLDIDRPIYVTTKPWGSTSTIVWWLMQRKNIQPDIQLASLMLSAILSDTVGFKSSTTTQVDRDAAQNLARLAKIIDVDDLTLEIFKAKSNVANLSPKELVLNDYKVFEFGDKKVLIDQIETVEQDKVIEQKDDIVAAMQEVKTEQKLDHIFVAVSDILAVNTKLLVAGEQGRGVAEKAFGGQVEGEILDIGPKLSRKKEIAPAIEKAVTNS